EDYLVLSASLSEYRPEGPWLRLLAERFDLRSGRCLVQGVAPKRAPAVRVTEEVPEAPSRPVVKPSVELAVTGAAGARCVMSPMPAAHDGDADAWYAEDESDLNEWPVQ